MDGMLSMDSAMAFVSVPKGRRPEEQTSPPACLVCATPHVACGFRLRSLTGSRLECPTRARPAYNLYFHKSKGDHG